MNYKTTEYALTRGSINLDAFELPHWFAFRPLAEQYAVTALDELTWGLRHLCHGPRFDDAAYWLRCAAQSFDAARTA